MAENSRKLTLSTSLNPESLSFLNTKDKEMIIQSIVILTVDYKPIELILNNNFDLKNGSTDIINVYDVAALVIKLSNPNITTGTKLDNEETRFVMAEDVVRVSNKFGDLVMLNGRIDVIPDKMLIEVYKNFSNLKTVNLQQLEDILEISKNQPALKAYNQLSNYFSAENYFKNNNVFKLLQHQNDVVKVSKKVLIKSIVAWEIRK